MGDLFQKGMFAKRRKVDLVPQNFKKFDNIVNQLILTQNPTLLQAFAPF